MKGYERMTAERVRRNAGIARIVAACARRWPAFPLFWIFRKITRIQLTPTQLRRITGLIRSVPECRLLVFGLGNDSFYWHSLNADGETLFLENDDSWIELLLSAMPDLSAYKVEYWTRRSDWKRLADSVERLNMELPESVNDREWDVVLVDGPAGWSDNQPGRMQSIHAASRLCRNGGTVFVHDCEREVEAFWCNLVFPRSQIVTEVRGSRKHGWLREYRQRL